jgi:hypothetical protein
MTAACRTAPVSFVPGLCITDPSRNTFRVAQTYTEDIKFSNPSAPATIVIKLDFFKPFEGHNTAEFTMLPQGNATSVGWRMHGPLPFMGKVMHLFMNMDNMVGKDFASGLASLKRLAEK